jgi:ArsR family transcriptional regulator, arsenate/arsenite/antimonite-responsive transcriptional repressor
LSTTSGVLPRPRTARRATRAAAAPSADQTIEDMAELFKQLGDRSRLKILLALARHGEMHVSALCELLGGPSQPASQPAVSHHLNLLRGRKLVGFRRDGKHNFYRIDSARVHDLLLQFFADFGNGHRQLQFDDFSVAFKVK